MNSIDISLTHWDIYSTPPPSSIPQNFCYTFPMRNLTTILCLTLTLLLGSVGVSLGHEGLDGEYLRAIKTMGGSGINWIDAIFRYCVVLLVDLAKVLGISYEELNIWVFVIIQPLIMVFLFLWVLLLRRRIKRLKRS